MGWDENELFPAGDKLLFDAAVRLYVPVAPCRTAWRRVRKEHPLIELHDLPDRTHPGMVGAYLNLCCPYAALSGQFPVGLAAREVRYWPIVLKDGLRKRDRAGAFLPVNDALAAYLQSVAWDAWQTYQQRTQQGRKQADAL